MVKGELPMAVGDDVLMRQILVGYGEQPEQ